MIKKGLVLLLLLVVCSSRRGLAAQDYLFIPALDLALPIGTIPLITTGTGTWDTTQLGDGIGYLPPLPRAGQRGNIAIGGHNPGAFTRLRELSPGDLIILRSGETEYHYEVRAVIIIRPDNIQVLDQRENRLTLLTCSGVRWRIAVIAYPL